MSSYGGNPQYEYPSGGSSTDCKSLKVKQHSQNFADLRIDSVPVGDWKVILKKSEVNELSHSFADFSIDPAVGLHLDVLPEKSKPLPEHHSGHGEQMQRYAEDELADIWMEMAMAMALESSKDTAGENSAMDESEGEEREECEHSFILKDDLGYVCRLCGVIEKSIETIFDCRWSKARHCNIRRNHIS